MVRKLDETPNLVSCRAKMKLVNFLAMAALGYVIIWIYRDLREQLRNKDAEKAVKSPRKKASSKAYETLGISPDATLKEIKKAYQALIQKYHPDRVADMGPELRDVAEARTKEINAAYEELKRSHQ